MIFLTFLFAICTTIVILLKEMVIRGKLRENDTWVRALLWWNRPRDIYVGLALAALLFLVKLAPLGLIVLINTAHMYRFQKYWEKNPPKSF